MDKVVKMDRDMTKVNSACTIRSQSNSIINSELFLCLNLIAFVFLLSVMQSLINLGTVTILSYIRRMD